MNIRVLGKRCVVKPFEKSEQTKAGIFIIPKDEMVSSGEVRVVSPECKEVRVGNSVLFKKYSPDDIQIDGEDLMVLNEEDILAIYG